MPDTAPPDALSALDSRAREIFREIVEAYLATGDPVGSRTLSKRAGLALSPASIRNSMADLEALGEDVRRRVKEKSGITLEWEIKRVGVA